jgi:flagellar assembly factor FliW
MKVALVNFAASTATKRHANLNAAIIVNSKKEIALLHRNMKMAGKWINKS